MPRWPLRLIASPAAVAVWSSWVGLGSLSGFGEIHPLLGIWDSFRLNTAITLPVGIESYGAYALAAWLVPGTGAKAREFAGKSALWGWLWGWPGRSPITSSPPDAGSEWTDDGQRREERQLKHRADGESRMVPACPELVKLLRAHLEEFGTDRDGRLFHGVRGGELPYITYRRAWDRARRAGLTPEQYDSPLARRVYYLRHASLSTWLNGGVAPTEVAEWAGHGVDVLLRIYAKCLDGQDEIAKRRIINALRESRPYERDCDQTEPGHG